MDEEGMIHSNEHYFVELTPEDNLENNYQVVNIQYNTIEAETENLPQALIYAEQFNTMLTEDVHLSIGQLMPFENFGADITKH